MAASLAGSGLIYTGISKTFGIRAGDWRVSFFRNNVHFQRSVNDRSRVSVATSGVKAQVANFALPIAEEAPVVIVTGASTGFGKAIALTLGKAGCKVLVNYSRSSKEAEEVSQQIAAVGGQALAFEGDVSDREDAASMFKFAVDAWGTIDVLVNCAGITKNCVYMRMRKLEYQIPEILDMNIPSLSGCTEEAIKVMMKKRRGRIINVASVVNLDGDAWPYKYSPADGVIHFSKDLAKEIYNKGITVNVITPRFIASDTTANQDGDFMEKTLGKIQSGGYRQFEEAASLVECWDKKVDEASKSDLASFGTKCLIRMNKVNIRIKP